MEPDDVQIIGCNIRDKKTKKGDVILCYFDVDVPCFVLLGCVLYRFKNGSFYIAMPAIANALGQRCAVRITDDELRLDIQREALDTYRRMGGEVADMSTSAFAEFLKRAQGTRDE